MKFSSLGNLFLSSATLVLGAISGDGTCGGSPYGSTCLNSEFGSCCSQYGFCGRASAYCGTGCQSEFGTCDEVPSTTVSTDGSCGKGVTCLGSRYGSCCSQYGYCGSTRAYCGTDCNPVFGTCSVAAPSSSTKVSPDARCGNLAAATGGYTCLNSEFGDCCSQHGYCGSTQGYCGAGCQSVFGKCIGESPSSSVAPSSSISTAPSSSVTSSLTSSAESSSVISTESSLSASSTTVTSSSAETLSSSTVIEPTTSSASEIAVPTRPCMPVPDCQPFSGPLTDSCVSSHGKCQNGWVSLCSQGPVSGSIMLARLGTTTTAGDECALACDNYSDCVGFQYSPTSPTGPRCDLWGKITAVSTSFVSTWIRVCPAPPVVPSPTATNEIATSTVAPNSSTEASFSSSTDIASSTITSTSTSSIDSSSSTTAESSTTETTPDSTPVDSSSSSTAVLSPTPAPPSATPCTTNFVTNGGFEDAGQSPWTITPRPGIAGSISSPAPPISLSDSVRHFFKIESSGTAAIVLKQTLTGLKAGTVVSCSARFSFPGDGNGFLSSYQSTLVIETKNCGHGAGSKTGGGGWESYSSAGVYETLTIARDDPVLTVTVFMDNRVGGAVLAAGLDSVAVVAAAENGRPVCEGQIHVVSDGWNIA